MAVRPRSLCAWPSGSTLRYSTRRAHRAARATIARSGSFFGSSVVKYFGTIHDSPHLRSFRFYIDDGRWQGIVAVFAMFGDYDPSMRPSLTRSINAA